MTLLESFFVVLFGVLTSIILASGGYALFLLIESVVENPVVRILLLMFVVVVWGVSNLV